MDKLLHYDILALYKINVEWARPGLDQFWLIITHLDRQSWFVYGLAPLLLGALFLIYRQYALKPLLMVAIAVGVADAVNYRVIKRQVNRPRPFMNAEIQEWVRKVDDAHGPSFPSNHAANCFAGAGILAWYFRRQRYFFYSFALLVAISRPALGVHYPSDVLAGAIVGICVALLIRVCLLDRFLWFRLPFAVSSEERDSVDWRTRTGRQLHD